MAPEDKTPQTPDPLGTDPVGLKAASDADADQSKGEDAVEDEIAEVISTKTGEPRTFAAEDADNDARNADAMPMKADKHVDEQLDHGLKETFPASDPVSINPGAD